MDGEQRTGGIIDWLFSRTGVATAVAVAVIAFLIYTGHAAHLFGALPYLLIFSCPLIHFFMHGRHGSNHHHRDAPGPGADKNDGEPPFRMHQH